MTIQTTPQATPSEQKITIDGTEYKLGDLSETAKYQIMNLRITDQEITSLNQKLAIFQTARAAYARALAEELSNPKSSEKKPSNN